MPMSASGSVFSHATLAGEDAGWRRAVDEMRAAYGFDFVALGLTAFVGAPLTWVYSAGATGERHKRIVLAPGHGIGGIVIKSGKPMLFLDIDRELDPQAYSSYPIVFAEDLRSFCALPLRHGDSVVGVLLCAFRTSRPEHEASYRCLISDLGGSLRGLEVVDDDFMNFEAVMREDSSVSLPDSSAGGSEMAHVIRAQEDERRRISRDLHDGVAQEVLSVSFSLRRIEALAQTDEVRLIAREAGDVIDRILDELHNISVELRPLSLNYLGFAAALHSQATMLERAYGTRTRFEGDLACERFDPAIETQAYRICQEAMLNACKYSGADEIVVSMAQEGSSLCVSVRDEGVGFDVGRPQIRGSGCGLVGMRERAALIGAKVEVESGPGGTIVTLRAPMGELWATDDGEPAQEGEER